VKPSLPSLWRLQQRTRFLSRVMTLKEASRFALAEGTDAELRFHLKLSGREVIMRGGTSDVPCFEKIFLGNEYETPFTTTPRVIVDAGANIGLATLYYSQVYPHAQIIAIEPEHSNFNMLKKNCFGIPNVTLVKGALWSEETQLVIKNRSADKWAFSVTELPCASSASCDEIEALTIPAILRKFAVGRIDILKLDIEGAEYELFEHGAELWLEAIGQIVIELHDRFRSGCAQAFYTAIGRMSFAQEIRGESVFIKLGE